MNLDRLRGIIPDSYHPELGLDIWVERRMGDTLVRVVSRTYNDTVLEFRPHPYDSDSAMMRRFANELEDAVDAYYEPILIMRRAQVGG